jgi:acyl carrier protein
VIDTRIKHIFGEVLGVAPEAVGPDSSPESIAAWDSLHHMSLLLALEQEFGVVFADGDLPELTSFGRIRAALGRLEAA